MQTDTPAILPQALLFDMDGTLTEPMLDFPLIKREMGIGARPILEALAEMGSAERAAAETVLVLHEERAAAQSTLNPGCRELLDYAAGRGIGSALITRNSAASVKTVLARHELKIELLITREDGPAKPDPFPLRLACQKLGVAPADAWMVGDGQYDIEAGLAAGTPTVWVSHGRRPRPFEAEPWRTVADLHGLTELLRACLDRRR